VRRTIAQLPHESLQAIASGITQRRMAWLDRTLPQRPGYEGFSPRDVYELLFFEQMGLARDELPVVAESPDEIVWLSLNRCSLLEACGALGLDTRRVCRAVNEKATQAFVSRINPQLRFHRSYEEIRPYAPHCREWIRRLDFQACMRLAIEQAERSGCEGSEGHGAVVVYDGRVIGRALGPAATEGEPGLHAEGRAIRQAVGTSGDSDLCGAVLFSTHEPCPACASLAARANLTSLVYGAASGEGEGAQGCLRDIAGWWPSGIEVIKVSLPTRRAL
jgi:tRNA(Arg) A34 adenosine deaminase TadA